MLEAALGVDVTGIHLDTTDDAARDAAALGARAFTVGRDVAFGAGQFAPETRWGRTLLLHELVHATRDPDGRIRRDVDPYRVGERVSTSSESGLSGFGTVSAETWLRTNGPRLVQELQRLLEGVHLRLPIPEMLWRTQAEFVRMLFEPVAASPDLIDLVLSLYLLPDRLVDAINVGRDVAVVMFGGSWWEEGVVAEVGRRLIVRINDSLARVAPGVLGGVMNAWSPEMTPVVEPVPRPGLASFNMGGLTSIAVPIRLGSFGDMSPPKTGESFTHPVDSHVASALRHAVAIEAAIYWSFHQEEFTPEAIAEDVAAGERPLRRVRLEFLAARGLNNWVRAIDPTDATALEVAFELYGDASAAHRLLAVPPLFAIPEEDFPSTIEEPIVIDTSGAALVDLTPRGFRPFLRIEHVYAWQEAVGKAPNDRPFSTGIDPTRELLESELADEAAIQGAARIVPTPGANDELILERLRVIASLLRQMEPPAVELSRPPGSVRETILVDPDTGATTIEPYDPTEVADVRRRIVSTRERVERRSSELAKRSGIAVVWDGQTAGQLEIVTTALNGVSFAVHLAEQYLGWPSIFNLVRDVAMSYIEAAEISDLYVAARARLDAAERRSVLFPTTAMELWLARLRVALDEARTSEITAYEPNATGLIRGVDEMDKLERDLRGRLARIRAELLSNPSGARDELQAILDEINHLQTGVSIAMNLDTVDRVWQALHSTISFWGEVRALWGGGNAAISRAITANHKLNDDWQEILKVWRDGDRAEARRLLDDKARGPWRTYVSDIASQIDDHQMWDSIMNFAAMVGIALLSGGLGAYVEAGAGAYWGVTAASSMWARVGVAAVGVTTEATAFTALTYPMQPGDVGFGEYFLTNLVFSGGARTIGAGFEKAVGQKFARSFEGQVATGTVQTTAMIGANLVMADVQSQQARNQHLDSHDIASISLENIAFVGATTLGAALLRTPLRNLRLRGHLDGLQLRHNRNLTALSRTMERLPQGRPPEALRRKLFDEVQRALDTEQALTANMREIVERADRLDNPKKRERMLRRYGITEEMAAAYRSGAVPSEVLANLKMMQGMRVARSLEPVGTDFAVHPEMFDEAISYFRSLPDTQVISGDLSILLDPTMQLMPVDITTGQSMIVAHGPLAVPIEHGARSFVVKSGEDAPFRVYERSRVASGELAPRIELASRPEVARAERLVGESRTTGGRASAEPFYWNLPSEAIQALRQRVLAAGVGPIQRTAQRHGLRVDRAALERVRNYMFDSAGIAFLPENYQWWQRLQTGRVSVHDMAILIHELAENARFEDIRRQTGFDYMGANWEQMSRPEQERWRADFDRLYEHDAHARALEVEYDYLAQQVRVATNGRVRLGRNVVAAVDPVRAEGRMYMKEGDHVLQEHIRFDDWKARGSEVVEIGTSAMERLNLPDRFPTLSELVGAVHGMPLHDQGMPRGPAFGRPGAEQHLGGDRSRGWRPGRERPGRQRGRGGATWDPTAHPNPSFDDILTVPFADGHAIGRDLFRRGRDLVIRATSLTAEQKADAFEQLTKKITAIDPSWSATRGSASNAVGFFTGDQAPFGLAIDAAGVLWQTRDFSQSVRWGPQYTVTIDFDKWQKVTP